MPLSPTVILHECLQRYAERLPTHVQCFSPLSSVHKAAMELEVQKRLSAITKWKQELDPQERDKLHLLAPVVWPVTVDNSRRQIFEHLMTPERAKTNIFEVHARSHDESRTTLGRIKWNSVRANLTFDKTTDFGRMNYLQLPSPPDLVQGSPVKN